MPFDKSPVFRKPVFSWYHSKAAYGIAIAVMLLVFLFGMAGIAVSRENDQYGAFIWVPVLLVILSGALILTVTLRLIRRYISK